MSAGELLTAGVVGVLPAVVLGGMVWLDWCEELDRAARRARQQPEPSGSQAHSSRGGSK